MYILCQYIYVYFYSPTVLSKCMASKLCFGYLPPVQSEDTLPAYLPVAGGVRPVGFTQGPGTNSTQAHGRVESRYGGSCSIPAFQSTRTMSG